MNVNPTASAVIDACEKVKADHMVTGAFAFNCYGIPRSTKDFDLVVDVSKTSVNQLIQQLEGTI